jgi:hypothetical protein
MFTQKSKLGDSTDALLVKGAEETQQVKLGGVFNVKCFDEHGALKWEDTFANLVMNEGLQDINNQYFKGVGYSATWYMGLVTGPGSGTTYSASDTLASHTWTEFTNYTGNRKTLTFGTPTLADPSVIDNAASPCIFAITGAGGTVAGAFITTVSTGTSGLLFSAGDFNGGDKIVASGDTLNVTYTFSADAA